MAVLIKVENKFEMAQRDIHVLRKSQQETLEEHRVCCPYGELEEENPAVRLPLGMVEGQVDYLEISVDNDQVELDPCKIELSANVPFTFIPAGTESITVVPSENGGNKISLKIPPGLPKWKLEVMEPAEPVESTGQDLLGMENSQWNRQSSPNEPNVTVGDDGTGGED